MLLIAACLASLGSFSFGYQLGAPDAAAPALSHCPHPARPAFSLPSSPESLSSLLNIGVGGCFKVDVTGVAWGQAVAMLCAGALVGCLAAGPLADRLGRKPTILLCNGAYMLGTLLGGLAVNLGGFAIGRLLIGMAVGGCCVAVPLYLTEISPLAIRGFIGSMHQMAIVLGYLAVQLTALGLRTANGMNNNWRLLYGLNLIPCILQLILFSLLCPESPIFLSTRGYRVGAREAMEMFTRDQVSVEAKLEPSAAPQTAKMGLMQVLGSPIARRSLTAACLLHFAQQLSGINGVFCYAGELFRGVWWTLLALALLNVAMTILAIWLMDRAGRRSLLLFSIAICIATLSLSTITDWLHLPLIGSLSILAFVAAFAVGLGPVPWLMVGELFPPEAAAAAVSLAVCVNWTFNYVVTATFPLLAGSSARFVPFIAVMIPVGVYAYLRIPETRGRPAGYL